MRYTNIISFNPSALSHSKAGTSDVIKGFVSSVIKKTGAIFCKVPAFCFLSDVDKFFVFSGNGHQLVVGALLDDLAVINNEYFVGIAHGFQPMGNHDDGLVLGQLGDGLHQLFFIFRVHIGRGLVQNDDRRVLHDRPGDGNALSLTTGECCTALTDNSVKAVWQRHDKVVAPRLLCRGLYLLHGGIGLSEADIVGDGVREQIGPLKHKGEIADEAVVAVLPYIPSAEAHTAGLHIPEPGHKIAEGRFATS